MGMHKGMCGRCEPNGPATPDVYLRDYIARKTDKPKLTFEQWWNNYMHWQFSPEIGDNPEVRYRFGECWKAAQENV